MDESGRLANVPSVNTLRKALKERNGGTGDASAKEKAVLKSLMDQIGETVRGRLAEARLSASDSACGRQRVKRGLLLLFRHCSAHQNSGRLDLPEENPSSCGAHYTNRNTPLRGDDHEQRDIETTLFEDDGGDRRMGDSSASCFRAGGCGKEICATGGTSSGT